MPSFQRFDHIQHHLSRRLTSSSLHTKSVSLKVSFGNICWQILTQLLFSYVSLCLHITLSLSPERAANQPTYSSIENLTQNHILHHLKKWLLKEDKEFNCSLTKSVEVLPMHTSGRLAFYGRHTKTEFAGLAMFPKFSTIKIEISK